MFILSTCVLLYKYISILLLSLLTKTKTFFFNHYLKINVQNIEKLDLQCPPLILAPLINVRKGVCENKSALFILLIFHSKNSQNSNLSLK